MQDSFYEATRVMHLIHKGPMQDVNTREHGIRGGSKLASLEWQPRPNQNVGSRGYCIALRVYATQPAFSAIDEHP
jgi:hypothetical protein